MQGASVMQILRVQGKNFGDGAALESPFLL